jgi:hypothetical protein
MTVFKNLLLKLRIFLLGSEVKVWWICKRDRQWETLIAK